MGPTPYIPSFVLLEEHRQRLRQNMSQPDTTAARVRRMPKLRRRVSLVLRVVADWLDPEGARSRDVRLFIVRDAGHRARKEDW